MRRKLLPFILSFVFLAVYIIRAYWNVDPDFGFRLMNGRLILQGGIDAIKSDPFSYTMPSYSYVEHSWGWAVFIAKIYSWGGYWLASMISAVLVFFSLFVVKSKKYILSPIFLLAVSSMLIFSQVRSAAVSFFFFSLITYLVYNPKFWDKYKYYLPFLFLVWVNIHGAFVEGLAVVSLIVVAKTLSLDKIYFKQKFDVRNILKSLELKINFTDIFIVLTCYLASLLNPFGFRVWEEIGRIAGQYSVKWQIIEWVPTLFVANFLIAFYLTLSSILIFKNYKKISLMQIFILIFVLLQSLEAFRNFAFWVIISLPFTYKAYLDLEKHTKKHSERFVFARKTLIVFVIILSIAAHYPSLFGKRLLDHPDGAISYLKSSSFSGNVFNYYNWGGYLTWKYPEKKVFIDGRMNAWVQPPIPGESESAIVEYWGVVKRKRDYKQVFEKYNISTVIFPESEFADYLIENGWVVVYSDNVALVLRSPAIIPLDGPSSRNKV